LIIDSVEFAHHREDGHTKESSSKLIMFKGKKAVSIPVGKELYSDTINFSVKKNQVITVSMYLPNKTKTTIWNFTPFQSTYATEGNHTKGSSASVFATTLHSYYWLKALDVKVVNKKHLP
jgi:hypothetical protein